VLPHAAPVGHRRGGGPKLRLEVVSICSGQLRPQAWPGDRSPLSRSRARRRTGV